MNSELYDNTYFLPPDVLKHIQTTLVSIPNGEGVKRAKFLLKNGSITYQAMKRINNFFDTYNGQDNNQYQLAGGDLMRSFIETSLNQDRSAVDRSKKNREEMNIDVTNIEKVQQIPRINENDAANDAVSDAVSDGLKKNALAIIVNKNNQILLLKRGDNKEYWQPNKWSLVGGGVDDGEEPVKACQREIKEETDLDISTFSHKYIIQRNADSVEYIFVCKHDGDDYDIKLDTTENVQYGWFAPEEMRFLDHVPNLIDYVNLAFKKYD